jgi:hypothetical protein
MSRAAAVPADTDILCERCGYVLNGLPPDGRCPECGEPAADSSPTLRSPPAWERADDPRPKPLRWIDTTAAVMFRPRRFFRQTTTRPAAGKSAVRFAQTHWLLASLLLGAAAFLHINWFYMYTPGRLYFSWLVIIPLVIGTYLFLAGLHRLAAWLTNWEATYRGLRLPLPVVLRGMHYHAAHYLPVAFVAFATVAGYRLALVWGWAGAESGVTYLYVLSAEVVLAAIYLFKTYWTAMRNLMYANA